MAGPLPHSKQFANWADAYLSDTEDAVRLAVRELKKSAAYKGIYQNSFAADAAISKLSVARWRPSGHGIRSVLLRIPLVVATRQLSLATVELRRLAEMTFWVCYFTDHPIEWAEFQLNPGAGFHPALDQPIRYCAHRGIKFYVDYTAERMAAESSGMAIQAIQDFRNLSNRLNSIVHPSHLSTAQRRSPPFEDISEASLKAFSELQRQVFSSAAIILAAIFRKEFDALPAMHRAQFDWLVGTAKAKRIRSAPFGLK